MKIFPYFLEYLNILFLSKKGMFGEFGKQVMPEILDGEISLKEINYHMQEEKELRLFVTGGTFDKEYNELKGNLFFRKTQVSEMLKLGRCKVDVGVRTLMLIDSLEMQDKDREEIAKNCLKVKESKIVITHGTDTMVETANYLASRVKDKTVVLTGAMVPYRFGSSDGMFNLGNAIAFAQTLPFGVYIVMNGRFFSYDTVRKNKRNGVFEKKQ